MTEEAWGFGATLSIGSGLTSAQDGTVDSRTRDHDDGWIALLESSPMNQSPPNPTPPILLLLVTVLFAVTWNYDRPDCPAAPPACTVSAVAPEATQNALPVVQARAVAREFDVQPTQLVKLVSLDTDSRSNTQPHPTMVALSDRSVSLPDWLAIEEPPRPANWLADLLNRAEQGIVR